MVNLFDSFWKKLHSDIYDVSGIEWKVVLPPSEWDDDNTKKQKKSRYYIQKIMLAIVQIMLELSQSTSVPLEVCGLVMLKSLLYFFMLDL
jgi:hypothetical protein